MQKRIQFLLIGSLIGIHSLGLQAMELGPRDTSVDIEMGAPVVGPAVTPRNQPSVDELWTRLSNEQKRNLGVRNTDDLRQLLEAAQEQGTPRRDLGKMANPCSQVILTGLLLAAVYTSDYCAQHFGVGIPVSSRIKTGLLMGIGVKTVQSAVGMFCGKTHRE